MYAKLALSNIRKSFQDYSVYFITLILGVAIFYVFNSLGAQSASLSAESKTYLETIQQAMDGMTIFLSVILGALMIYANNYLIKRRKKELGLYQVLGMRKRQVSYILILETFLTSAVSFIIGIILGVLLSQAMTYVTASFFKETIVDFTFIFSAQAFFTTARSFVIIFLIMLVFNLKTLSRTSLIDLMSASRKNEKIKIKNGFVTVLLLVAALLLIGWSYCRLHIHGYEALYDSGAALNGPGALKNEFVHTTLLMIAGTVLFFYSIASALLKLSQMNKHFYFRNLNMFSSRQLTAKINTVTGSITAISLLLFVAICGVTAGISMSNNIEGGIRTNAPYDATLSLYNPDPIGSKEQNLQMPDLNEYLKTQDIDLETSANQISEVKVYGDTTLDEEDRISLKTISDASGLAYPEIFDSAEGYGDRTGADSITLKTISVSDYNAGRELRNEPPVQISNGEYLIAANMGNTISDYYSEVLSQNTPLRVYGQTLTPASSQCLTGADAVLAQTMIGMNLGTIIVNDNAIPSSMIPDEVIYQINLNSDAELPSDIQFERADQENAAPFMLVNVTTSHYLYQTVKTTSALFSYLAIYIGLIMVIACGAIISIQQLSFASDSRNNYKMLKQLGCPTKLCNRSLFKQILLYFALPLIPACIHAYVALSVLFDFLENAWPLSINQLGFGMLFAFIGLYLLYFLGTYLSARGIVNSKK